MKHKKCWIEFNTVEAVAAAQLYLDLKGIKIHTGGVRGITSESVLILESTSPNNDIVAYHVLKSDERFREYSDAHAKLELEIDWNYSTKWVDPKKFYVGAKFSVGERNFIVIKDIKGTLELVDLDKGELLHLSANHRSRCGNYIPMSKLSNRMCVSEGDIIYEK